MADGDTRRVIEVQSDLYQKGNLEKEGFRKTNISIGKQKEYATESELQKWNEYSKKNMDNTLTETEKNNWDILSEELYKRVEKDRNNEVSKLRQYSDPTAHFRMIREEVSKAAQDGKTKLQFPTGETAMNVE
jgi:uncharacterized protein YnzC (UPF0291/DUF896 family)